MRLKLLILCSLPVRNILTCRRASICSKIFKKLGRTIRQWFEPIIRMWRFTKSNGITEGFHRKMKLIQRRAYGYRNFQNYRLRVLIECGHIVIWKFKFHIIWAWSQNSILLRLLGLLQHRQCWWWMCLGLARVWPFILPTGPASSAPRTWRVDN